MPEPSIVICTMTWCAGCADRHLPAILDARHVGPQHVHLRRGLCPLQMTTRSLCWATARTSDRAA